METLKEEVEVSGHSMIKVDSSADQDILWLATNEAALGPCRVETLKEEVEVSRHSNIRLTHLLWLATNEAALGPH